jgi:hypothetical protein
MVEVLSLRINDVCRLAAHMVHVKTTNFSVLSRLSSPVRKKHIVHDGCLVLSRDARAENGMAGTV